MAERGLNSGFTGIVSIVQQGTIGQPNPPFAISINSFNTKRANRAINRTGPGSAGVPKYRLANLRGGFTFDGEVRGDLFPFPSGSQYCTGTLVRQFDTNCTITYPVRISELEHSHVEKGKGESETWQVSGSGVQDGAETITWRGSQVSFSQPSFNYQQTYEGLSKTLDDRGLTTVATQRVDVENIGDTDTQEAGLLASFYSVFSSAPPMPNLKIIDLSLTKAEDDATGATVIIRWGLQDSKDDVETPKNTIDTDPYDLVSNTHLAIVYTTGSPPSNPDIPAGQQLRDVIDQKLNDQLSYRLYTWAKNTTADDQELPRTKLTLDATNIGTEGTTAIGGLDATPTLPGGYVLVNTTTENPTPDHTITTLKYALLTTQQGIEFGDSIVNTDPQAIKTVVLDCHVYDTTDGPPAPSAPSGLKLVDSKVNEINTLRSKITYQYGYNNSKDEIERSLRYGTEITTDPFGYTSRARIVKVAATQPSTPTNNPAGTGLINVVQRIVTDSLNMYQFEFGVLNSSQELSIVTTKIDDSNVPLSSTANVPLVNQQPSSSYLGMTLAYTGSRYIGNGNTLYTGEYALRNKQQEVQFDGSDMSLSPFANDNAEKITVVQACAATDVLETIAQAYYNTVKGTTSPVQGVPFRRLLARRYHSTAVIYTTEYQGYNYVPPQNSGTKSRISGSFGLLLNRSYVVLTLTGSYPTQTIVPQLYVLPNVTRGTGKYLVQLSQVADSSVGGPFNVTQQFVGSSLDLGGAYVGTTNNFNFFGYVPGTVMYLGVDYQIIINNGGTITFIPTYKFTYNSKGFYTIVGIPSGGLFNNSSTVTAGFLSPDVTSGLVREWTGLNGTVILTFAPQTDFGFATWSQT